MPSTAIGLERVQSAASMERNQRWQYEGGAHATIQGTRPRTAARALRREWAERFFTVHRWTKMPRGGHFAALEEPEALAEEIRAFFRPLR